MPRPAGPSWHFQFIRSVLLKCRAPGSVAGLMLLAAAAAASDVPGWLPAPLTHWATSPTPLGLADTAEPLLSVELGFLPWSLLRIAQYSGLFLETPFICQGNPAWRVSPGRGEGKRQATRWWTRNLSRGPELAHSVGSLSDGPPFSWVLFPGMRDGASPPAGEQTLGYLSLLPG